jgi:hypothetical protein
LYLPENKRLQLEAHNQEKIKQQREQQQQANGWSASADSQPSAGPFHGDPVNHSATNRGFHHDQDTTQSPANDKRSSSMSGYTDGPGQQQALSGSTGQYFQQPQSYGYQSMDTSYTHAPHLIQQGSTSMAEGSAGMSSGVSQYFNPQQTFHALHAQVSSSESTPQRREAAPSGPQAGGSGLTSTDIEVFEVSKSERDFGGTFPFSSI